MEVLACFSLKRLVALGTDRTFPISLIFDIIRARSEMAVAVIDAAIRLPNGLICHLALKLSLILI